jgi:hypothetical protein
MKRMILCAIAVMMVGGCTRAEPENSKPESTHDNGTSSSDRLTLPKGAGNWVVFKEEQSLDSLIDKTIDMSYLTAGAVVSPGAPTVKRLRVTLRPTPLNPNDRCGLQVVSVTVTTTAGKEFTAAATGHVTDNSDGMIGMRIEVSRNGGSGLAIPTSATGTVNFDQDVTVPLSP